MVNFAKEDISAVWDEASALVSANHAETGALGDECFAPSRDRYLAINDVGQLRLFTARDESGALVGYALFFVTEHLHYPSLRWACQDVMYLHPDHRGVTGAQFIVWLDAQLFAEGVNGVYRHVSRKKDYHRTLERMGYQEVEVGYWRRF